MAIMILSFLIILLAGQLRVSLALPASDSQRGLQLPLQGGQVDPDEGGTTCSRLAREVLRSKEPTPKSAKAIRAANELAACLIPSAQQGKRAPLYVAGELQVAENAPRLALTALSHLLLSIPTISPPALKPDVQKSRSRCVPQSCFA
jgi:hypothetical protein